MGRRTGNMSLHMSKHLLSSIAQVRQDQRASCGFAEKSKQRDAGGHRQHVHDLQEVQTVPRSDGQDKEREQVLP